MVISYESKFLEIVKNCSHIANMIAIQKNEKGISVAHKNNVMAFILDADETMFNVDEPIAFLDFKEFYSIMNTIGQEPVVEKNSNVLTIIPNNQNMKLNYVLADYSIISKVEKRPNIDSCEGRFLLPSDILDKMKNLSKLIGLNNELNRPRVDLISKSGRITMIFRDNSERGNNNFEYSFENMSETPMDFEKSININAILDLPNGSYSFSVSVGEIQLINMKMQGTEKFNLNFYAGYLR